MVGIVLGVDVLQETFNLCYEVVCVSLQCVSSKQLKYEHIQANKRIYT